MRTHPMFTHAVIKDASISQLKPVETLIIHLSKIHFNIIFPSTPEYLQQSLLLRCLPKFCMHSYFHIRALYPVHSIRTDVIMNAIHGEYSFLNRCNNSCFLGPSNLLRNLLPIGQKVLCVFAFEGFLVGNGDFDILHPVVCLRSGLVVPSTQLFLIKKIVAYIVTFVFYYHMFRPFMRSSSEKWGNKS
jgi:hypothetical protein